MRFNNSDLNHSINNISFGISVGYTGPGNIQKDSVNRLTYMDGSLEGIDYLARTEYEASFNIEKITLDEFNQLTSFLEAYRDSIINITQENSHEVIFLENWHLPFEPTAPYTYQVKLLDYGEFEEQDFSVNRGLFKLRITVAVDTDTHPELINRYDTSLYDFLIDIDTLSEVRYTQAERPEPDLTFERKEGVRWLNSTNREVREFVLHNGDNIGLGLSGASYTIAGGFAVLSLAGAFNDYEHVEGDSIYLTSTTNPEINGLYKISHKGSNEIYLYNPREILNGSVVSDVNTPDGWDTLLYVLADDDPNIGFYNGVFHLSCFTSHTSGVDEFTNTYVAGHINLESLRFDSSKIPLNNGPAVETMQGFSFSLRDNDKFWAYVINNNINLYRAKCSATFYKKEGIVRTFTKHAVGYNTTNKFSFTDYVFNCRPFLFSFEKNLPETLIDSLNQRYANTNDDVIGKSPYLTYGQYRYAALQNLSSEVVRLSVLTTSDEIENRTRVTSIFGNINRLNTSQVFIAFSENISDFTYIMEQETRDIISSGGVVLSVMLDTEPGSENQGESRLVTSFALSGGYFVLTLDEPLPTPPTTDGSGTAPDTDQYITFTLVLRAYRFQMNEAPSGGYGSYNAAGVFTPNIRVYILNEKGNGFEELPSTHFSQEGPDNSILVLNPRAVTTQAKLENFQEFDLGIPSLFESVTQAQNINTPALTYSEGALADAVPVGVTQEFYKARVVNYFAVHTYARQQDPLIQNSRVGGFQNPAFSNLYAENFHISTVLTTNESATYNNNYDYAVQQVISFPVDHSNPNVEETLYESGDVRIGLTAKIMSMLVTRKYGNEDNPTEINFYRNNSMRAPLGFLFKLRFRTISGAYIENEDWEFEIEREELSCCLSGSIPLTGYQVREVATSLADFGVHTSNYLYKEHIHSQARAQDIYPEINSLISGQCGELIIDNINMKGDNTFPTENYDELLAAVFSGPIGFEAFQGRVWEHEQFIPHGALIFTRSLIQSFWRWDAFTNTWNDVTSSQAIQGRRFLKCLFAEENVSSGFRDNGVYVYDESLNDLIPATPATGGITLEPKVTGKDLFDVSSLFDVTRLWDSVVAMEFSVSAKNYIEPPIIDLSLGYQTNRWACAINFINAPKFFVVNDFSATDVQIFADVRGKILTTNVFGEDEQSPFYIVKDIMDTLFPLQWDESSLVTLLSYPSRQNWKWRKQFIKEDNAKKVLEELCLNLWAVAIFNGEGKLTFKSILQDDFPSVPSTHQFSDSNILLDSIKGPAYRQSDDIYQQLSLNWGFNPASEFSSSFKKYSKSQFVNDNSSNISSETKYILRASRIINNLKNTKTLNFDYHYYANIYLDQEEGVSNIFPLYEGIAKHFAGNVWFMSFEGSIDPVIEGTISKGDIISIESYFFTRLDNELPNVVRGFVVGITPIIYKAIAFYDVYVFAPPGIYGPLHDPFKNAKLIPSRGVWTDTINEAGPIESPNTSSFPRDPLNFRIDDAGASGFPRTIT